MDQYSVLSDSELLQRIEADDECAFAVLYTRYSELLLAYAYTYLHDQADAEDVVHDLFATVWDKRHQIRIHSSVRSYLYRAVLNRILDRADRTRYFRQYLAAVQRKLDLGAPAADEALLERELAQQFETTLQQLPAKTREVFNYFRKHNKSRREVAEDLHLSTKTVNWHLQAVLKLIRKGFTFLVYLLIGLFVDWLICGLVY